MTAPTPTPREALAVKLRKFRDRHYTHWAWEETGFISEVIAELEAARAALAVPPGSLAAEQTLDTQRLSASEQKYILSNPDALVILMDYHDFQQEQADNMDAECWGNELRAEALRLLGAEIVKADPEIFSDEIRRRFGPLNEYAAKRLERAKERSAAIAKEPI